MAELMIFKDVITEQGMPFVVHKKGVGEWVRGKWVEGQPTEEEMTGIILPLVAGSKNVGEALNYIENGVYTAKEKKLFVVESIPIGSTVTYKDEDYVIQDFKDYSDYTDVHIYLMRHQSNVKESMP